MSTLIPQVIPALSLQVMSTLRLHCLCRSCLHCVCRSCQHFFCWVHESSVNEWTWTISTPLRLLQRRLERSESYFHNADNIHAAHTAVYLFNKESLVIPKERMFAARLLCLGYPNAVTAYFQVYSYCCWPSQGNGGIKLKCFTGRK